MVGGYETPTAALSEGRRELPNRLIGESPMRRRPLELFEITDEDPVATYPPVAADKLQADEPADVVQTGWDQLSGSAPHGDKRDLKLGGRRRGANVTAVAAALAVLACALVIAMRSDRPQERHVEGPKTQRAEKRESQPPSPPSHGAHRPSRAGVAARQMRPSLVADGSHAGAGDQAVQATAVVALPSPSAPRIPARAAEATEQEFGFER